MDRYSGLNEEDVDEEDIEATMLITGDDLLIVMKALDVYAYSLIMAQAQSEFERVKEVAETILKIMPKKELDS